MSLCIHALPIVNAELFCKRWVYSLPHESNGGVDGRWLPIHITHSISSSQLQLELLLSHVMVLQRMRCNWALIMRRPASQLYVSIAAFDVATRRTRSAGCKRCNMLVSQPEDVADSLNDAVLKLSNTLVNDFHCTEQCERRQSKCCGWVHVGKWEYLPTHCRRLWDCASVPMDRTFPRPYI